MADMAQLVAACDAVVQRLKSKKAQEVSCPLCGVSHDSQDALLVHLFGVHHIRTVDFADVADLSGFLAALETAVFGHDRSTSNTVVACCPVCGVAVIPAENSSVNSKAEALPFLDAHVAQTSHATWNEKTIPSLTPFLVPVLDEDTEVDKADTQRPAHASTADVENDQEGWEAVQDLDEGWEEPIQCLYCSEVSPACLEHMKRAHAFDLPAATRQHPGVSDEYDIIRLLNAVRADWRNGKCPGCDLVGSVSDREDHLRAHPAHRLPDSVPQGDDFLRPVIPGDSLLSLVVTAGEGFLACEEEDPDFPMVPTVQERAAKQRSSTQ